MNGALDEIQAAAAAHHLEQFGNPPLAIRGLKVGEEAGEIQAAVVRHLTQRDGRSWLPEIEAEIGDTMIALLMLTDSLDLSLQELTERAVAKFLAREWVVDKFPEAKEAP